MKLDSLFMDRFRQWVDLHLLVWTVAQIVATHVAIV